MQWYLCLLTITTSVVLGWLAFELLGRPLRALFELRHRVFEQLVILENVVPPQPRELAVSSKQIREYDHAARSVREARRVFRGLGSQLLALGENEPLACYVAASIGFDPIVAGSGLIQLAAAYSRSDADRGKLRHQIRTALRAIEAAPGAGGEVRKRSPPPAVAKRVYALASRARAM